MDSTTSELLTKEDCIIYWKAFCPLPGLEGRGSPKFFITPLSASHLTPNCWLEPRLVSLGTQHCTSTNVPSAKLIHENVTYMEVVIEVLLRLVCDYSRWIPLMRLFRFLQSEPKPTAYATVPGNVLIQAAALDLLQVIVSRGEVDAITLDNIEACIISKLYAAVHKDRPDLQNKLLHSLHSVIVAAAALEPVTPNPKSRTTRTSDVGPYVDDYAGQSSLSTMPTSSTKVNPLLVQTLIDGLSRNASRPVLQHWIDFILMTVPQLHQPLSHLVSPLCDCVCRQLRSSLENVTHVYLVGERKAVKSWTTDADFIMLLNALERLVLLGLTKSDVLPADEEPSIQEKGAVESGGILGLVSNVFGGESGNLNEDYLVVSSIYFAHWLALPTAVFHAF